jgi:uncharacterized protein
MKLSGVYRVPAPQASVFGAITDPAVLQQVIEGCEKMVKTGEGSYDAHLKIGLAGIKGSYVGKVQLQDLNAPHSYTLAIEGKGAPGFVKGLAKIVLVAQDEGTEIRCEADAHVGGLIAAIGSRLVEAAARKMMAEFFERFAKHLKATSA